MPDPNAKFDIYNMMLPGRGPLDVPVFLDFSTVTEIEIDFSDIINKGLLDYVSTVFINNRSNSQDITFICEGTNMNLIFPAGYVGLLPLLVPNPAKIKAIASAVGFTITAHFTNLPMFPFMVPGPNSVDQNVNIAEIGGVAVTTPLAVTPTAPIGGAYTDRSIASLSGASENLMAANANRRSLTINNINAANPIAVNLTGGAAALNTAGSITLLAGASLVFDQFPPSGAITVIGTALDGVTAYEG